MEKRGKEIFLTSKGRQLLGLVPEDLKKPELTADWEMRLSKIAEGKLEKNTFIQDIEGYTRELTGEIRTGEGTFRHDNLTNKRCPQCGKRLLAVNGKNSRLLVCQDRECGCRETIARTSNARCPQCHRKMELVGKGEDETFICCHLRAQRKAVCILKNTQGKRRRRCLQEGCTALFKQAEKRDRRASEQCICRSLCKTETVRKCWDWVQVAVVV